MLPPLTTPTPVPPLTELLAACWMLSHDVRIGPSLYDVTTAYEDYHHGLAKKSCFFMIIVSDNFSTGHKIEPMLSCICMTIMTEYNLRA